MIVIFPSQICGRCFSWLDHVLPIFVSFAFIFSRNARAPCVGSALDGSLCNAGHRCTHAPTAGLPSPGHCHDPSPHLLCGPGAHPLPSWCFQCELFHLTGSCYLNNPQWSYKDNSFELDLCGNIMHNQYLTCCR